MYLLDVSIEAVVLAALVPLLVGSFYYSPMVFGNHWLRLSGLKNTDIKRTRLALMSAFLASFLAAFVMSYILALLIEHLFIYSVFDGIKIGFYLWLGFVATTTLPEYLFSDRVKPFFLYFLVNGYHLLSIIIMAGLLTIWL